MENIGRPFAMLRSGLTTLADQPGGASMTRGRERYPVKDYRNRTRKTYITVALEIQDIILEICRLYSLESIIKNDKGICLPMPLSTQKMEEKIYYAYDLTVFHFVAFCIYNIARCGPL